MKKIIYSFVSMFSVLAIPAFVFAQDDELHLLEEPMWFSMLEVFGILVAIIGLYYIVKIVKAQSQGILGKAFRFYGIGIVSVSLSLAYKGTVEMMGIESGFIHELVYEGFIYIGIIMFAVGSEIAYKALVNIGNMVKK